jgi:hypothetical protein
MRSDKCPFCGAERARDDKFCKACGARLRERGGVGPRSSVARLLGGFLTLFPGFARPKVIGAVLAMMLMAVGPPKLVLDAMRAMDLAGFVLLPVLLLLIGCGLLEYWAALCWTIYGSVCNPIDALSDFDAKRWAVLMTVGLLPLAGLLVLLSA